MYHFKSFDITYIIANYKRDPTVLDHFSDLFKFLPEFEALGKITNLSNSSTKYNIFFEIFNSFPELDTLGQMPNVGDYATSVELFYYEFMGDTPILELIENIEFNFRHSEKPVLYQFYLFTEI